ncbi:MAG: FIST C-terminal domain-containing protein [Clostridiales Family XIII bacterium]|jgi:hypothetical protein|nr:FIST C-terminal domain-containing protein [Clostridiales Family XIII bacterium]
MKSAVAISHELDNAAEAARQLADSVLEKIELKKHSVGILLCDADTDGAAVTGELKKRLGIDVAGMTTLATMDADGRHEAAAVLTVLTADDCVFSAAASASLSASGYEQKITEAYAATVPADAAAYGAKPAVVFAFCPYGLPFSGDKYPETLSKAAQDAPVMGGVASDDYDYERARVFLSGHDYSDALVVVSVWGEAKPVFAIRHVTSRFAERIRRVVRAEGNVVHDVGGETFVQYLEGFGLKTDVEDPLLAFTSYPMMLTQEGQDETPLMRHIFSLNAETGSGSFLGDVPTGALANICLVNKDDVKAACRESMKALLETAAAQPGYEYSAVFCISCCGRAMILGAEADAEGRILSEMLPENLSLTGAYCLGEICPALYTGEKASNRFHNCSITFCML